LFCKGKKHGGKGGGGGGGRAAGSLENKTQLPACLMFLWRLTDVSNMQDKNIWLITREQLTYYVTQFRTMQPNPTGVIPGTQVLITRLFLALSASLPVRYCIDLIVYLKI